jgi:serine/threonine protein kinase
MLNKLVVIAGRDKGRVFRLPETGTFHIGRGQDTATRLNDLRVSRSHCHVRIRGDEVLITDAQSKEGTFVNQQRLAPNAPHALHAGDLISLGDTELRLEVENIFDAPTMGADQLGALVDQQAKRDPLIDLAGTSLAHYRLGKVLAQGTAGVLFRARDTRADQEVALKVIRPEHLKRDGDVQRFLGRLRSLVPLRHANLVAVYDADKTDAYCWGALEFIAGDNLAQRLERAGANGVHWQHALRVALHVGRALDLLGQHRIVHGGILPRRILIQSSDNVAKLNAPMRIAALENSLADRATGGGEALQDLAYLPPERLRGEARGDSRSDIYSLGATVYTLLAGRPPFTGKTATDLAARIVQNGIVRPKEFQLSLPEPFEQVVLRMLAKRPEDRYPTPAELLADLERVLKRSEEPPVGPAPELKAPADLERVPAPPDALEHVPAAPDQPEHGPIAPEEPAPSPIRPFPMTPPEGMISETCVCGQVLQARAKYAGTRVRCPVCNSELVLPGRSTRATPAPPTPSWRRPSHHAAVPAPEETELPSVAPGSSLPTVLVYGVAAMIIAAALLFFGGKLVLEWVGQSKSLPPSTKAKASASATVDLPSRARSAAE